MGQSKLVSAAARVVLLLTVAELLVPCWCKVPPGYVKKPDHDQHPPKYEYGYDVKDGDGGVQGHSEARDGEFASGVYYVAIPHGGQSVQYFVDDWGYHPLVSYSSISPHATSRAQLALGEKAVAALYKTSGGLIQELKISPVASPLIVPKTGSRLIQAIQPQPVALQGPPAVVVAQQPVAVQRPPVVIAQQPVAVSPPPVVVAPQPVAVQGPPVVFAQQPAAVQSPAVAVTVTPTPQPLTVVSSEFSKLQRTQGLSGSQQFSTVGPPVIYQQNTYVPQTSYASLQPGLSYSTAEQVSANLASAAASGVQSSAVGGEDRVEFTSYYADSNAALPFGARINAKNALSSVQLTQGVTAVGNDQKFLTVTQPPVASSYTSLRPIVVSDFGTGQGFAESVTARPAVLAQTASSAHVESSSSYVSTTSGSSLTTALGGVTGSTVYSTEKPFLVTSTASYSTITPTPTPATVVVTPPPKILSVQQHGGYSQRPIVVPDSIQPESQGFEEHAELKNIQFSSSGGQAVFEESASLAQTNVNSNQESFVLSGGVDNRLQHKSFVENIPLNTYAADYNQQFFDAAREVSLGQYLQANPTCDPQIIHVEKQVPVPVAVEKPIVIEKTRIVEVEKPVTVVSTKVVEVEKPVHIESTKLVAVDRPLQYPQPYGIPQPYPYPLSVPQAVRVPVPHLVPYSYPQAAPAPYKEYHPIYLQGKQSTKTFNSYRKDSSFGGSLKSSVIYADQYPPRQRLPSSYRSGKNRNLNLPRYRPQPKKLCIEYGGFKPPMVPSEQIDEDPDYQESD